MTESVGSPPTGTPALPRETVPWVDPQAQVTDVVVIGGGPGGEVPPAAEASERGPVVHVVDVSTGEVPGSSVLSEGMDGTARLVIDHQCSVLVGVTISGGGVKEMLHAATVTVGARVSLTELWHAVPAFPTVALPDRGPSRPWPGCGRTPWQQPGPDPGPSPLHRHPRRATVPDVSFTNLLIIAAVAAVVPLALGWAPRLRVPSVVLEIVAGIVLGPSVLGWVRVDLPVRTLGLVGLAFLLLLAGLEIDVRGLRGRLLRLAGVGYVVSSGLAMLAGLGLRALGWTPSPLFLAVALTATSLGLIVPVLKDAGRIADPVGQTTVAAASVADFTAIVLLTLLFSTSGGGAGTSALFLGVFGVLVAVVALALGRVGMSMRLSDVLVRLQDTTAEIRVRLVILLLIAFVALAERLGLETILGAFLAGALVGLVDRDSATHPRFRAKLEAIGYGFLIPVFFVSSGVQLDLRGLIEQPSALVRVPVFLAALLVVRGVPAVLYVPSLGRRGATAAGLLQATSLPFLVTVAQIGTATGRLSGINAAALVCAGLLSVLIFPTLALGLLGRSQPASIPQQRGRPVMEAAPVRTD